MMYKQEEVEKIEIFTLIIGSFGISYIRVSSSLFMCDI